MTEPGRTRRGGDIDLYIDNSNRADRLGLVEHPEQWVALRQLRNRLVHDEAAHNVNSLQDIPRERARDLKNWSRIFYQFALGVAGLKVLSDLLKIQGLVA